MGGGGARGGKVFGMWPTTFHGQQPRNVSMNTSKNESLNSLCNLNENGYQQLNFSRVNAVFRLERNSSHFRSVHTH